MSNQQFQRIPQSFIDTLLDRTDIVDIVDSRVKLKRSGRNYTACCPFHKEKTPSFSVAPDKQFYYCFGCGVGGNAIGFLMDLERLNFPEAVEELARRAGLEVPRQETTLSSQELAAQQAKLQERKQSYDLLEQANQYYQKQLRHHPTREQAATYLKQRGLSDKIAQRFNIGYAPLGWQNLIDSLEATPDIIRVLLANGLAVQKENHKRAYDFFRERIMFPIRNNKGKVVAFGGRVLGEAKPKYLNSPETDVFHKERNLYGLYEACHYQRQLKRILVVEGYMDVVALAQHDINYAVATLGTATSIYHLERIFKVVQEVVFCFDGDAAGIKAAVRAMHTCVGFMTDGRQARFLLLPQGEDPDTLVRKEGHDMFSQRINNATPFSEFLFEHFSSQLDIHNLEHRAKLANDLWPIIAAMPKGLVQTMMRHKLEEVTGLNQDTLQQLVSVSEPEKKDVEKASHFNEDASPSKQELLSETAAAPQNKATQQHEPRPWQLGIVGKPAPDWYEEPYERAQPNFTYKSITHNAKQVLSSAQNAIRIILQYPQSAISFTEIPKHLRALRRGDAHMLVALLEVCQAIQQRIGRAPTASELMMECNDWQAWPLLRDLAAMESLDVAKDPAHQLAETIDRLQLHYIDQCFDELTELLNNPANGDELAEAKQQLQTLLKEKEMLQKAGKQ